MTLRRTASGSGGERHGGEEARSREPDRLRERRVGVSGESSRTRRRLRWRPPYGDGVQLLLPPPPEQGAGAEAPERAAGGAEISAEPLGEPSADEAPPAVALEALPLVPGIPEAAPAVALQALPMVPGAPRAPAQERRTVSPVDLHNQELTTETMEEAPPNLDDILARTEKIATILAQDSGTLAVELSELTRKLKASRAGAQRTLAAEATPPSIPASDLEQGPTPDRPGGADAGKDKEKEKSGGGWLEKSTISSPILTLNHQLADYPTYMFWSGVGLLSIIVCCSCCVRPMMRRRQEARDGRLL
mmetsp:Transcript_5514/g.14951  ORF Transcript_5514/g.14951 Transcript_5514/m.14951 type:complete len:304 (+) Transcript_5514:511-1422(+)